jgi:plasmid stabilization system protein ParE
MARLIIWSRRASEDLEAIAGYIGHDSEAYAKSVVRTILQKVRLLSDFPFMGRIVPEFTDDSIREIFAYSYRIIYKITEDKVITAAVVHSKRILDLSLKP